MKKEPKTKGINYPIGVFEYSEDFGDSVLTKELIETNENIWYLVRVYDIDLSKLSYIGQVVLKTESKLEAVLRWQNDANDEWKIGIGRHYYIFNPYVVNGNKAT